MTITLASQLCKLQNVEVNTKPSCPSATAASSALHGSASATRLMLDTTRPESAMATGTGAAAPAQTAGAGFGLGIAVIGLMAAL